MNFFTKKLPLKSLIEKATVDDQNPTPGFLYNEINKQSFVCVENSQIIQDHLLKRLKQESPDVKLKVLRVIKQLLMKGHRSFRTELQRRTNEIEICLEYRGNLDPIRGDKPYIRVRDEAKEIMKLLFVDIPSKMDLESIKGPNYDISQTSTSSLSGRIIGTGNYTPPPESNSILNKIKNSTIKLATTVRGGEAEEEFDASKHWSSDFKMSNFGRPPSLSDYENCTYDIGERVSKPGTPGGSWIENNNNNTNHDNDIDNDIELLHDESNDSNHNHTINNEYNLNDNTPEKMLVDKITSVGGVRSVLSRIEIIQFTRQISTLNIELISYLLYSKLNGNINWQSKLKALCLIEGMIKQNINCIKETKHIIPLLQSPQKSILEKSRKLLELMNFDFSSLQKQEETEKIELDASLSLFSGLRLIQSDPVLLNDDDEDDDEIYSTKSNEIINSPILLINENKSDDNEEDTKSAFDFIEQDEEDCFSFIENKVNNESERANITIKKHQKEILQKYQE